jgi:hypothetical protein
VVGQRRAKISRERLRDTLGALEERAERLPFSSQVRVRPVRVDDAARSAVGGLDEQHQVQAVMCVETKVRDERIRTRLEQLLARAVKVAADIDAGQVCAGLQDASTEDRIWLGDQQPGHQEAPARREPATRDSSLEFIAFIKRSWGWNSSSV